VKHDTNAQRSEKAIVVSKQLNWSVQVQRCSVVARPPRWPVYFTPAGCAAAAPSNWRLIVTALFL